MISPLAERAECWVITLAHSRLCCHPVLVLLYALLLTDVEFVIHFVHPCACRGVNLGLFSFMSRYHTFHLCSCYCPFVHVFIILFFIFL